ncbi:MAG: hypothetical protein WC770_08380 [Phycisphaerae bacterium]|jgi:hypothetical protein
MAAITFNCPKCGFICAFREVYTGRRARCLRCGQIFIIPACDGEIPQKVEPPRENEDPLPGFYEAVLKNSIPAIFNKQGLATLLFVLLVSVLKFFTIHFDFSIQMPGFTLHIPIGWVMGVLIWGGLFWVYGEIISATSFDIEFMPEVIFDGGFGYVFKVIEAIYTFFLILFLLLLPAIIFRHIFLAFGVNSKWAVLPFVMGGAFMLPMAVLAVSITRDVTVLAKFGHLFLPVKKAFWAYLLVAGLFAVGCQLQYLTRNYGDVANKSAFVIGLNLAFVLISQIIIVFAMRTAGLFYRHFACYFKW